MKKILVAAVLFAGLSPLTNAMDITQSTGTNTNPSTLGWGVNIFADYTTVSMGKANSQIDYVESGTKAAFGALGIGPTEIKFGGAFLAGLTANIEIPFLDIWACDIGLRGGYLNAFPGSVQLNSSDIMGSGLNIDLADTYNASLIPLEIGVAGKINIPNTAISASLGIYGGYGIASGSEEVMVNTNIPAGMGAPANDSVTIPYGGSCAVFEIIGNASIKINMLSLGLDLGYRIADVSRVKATKTVTDSNFDLNVQNGAVFKDKNGNAVDFDFGGLIVGLKTGIEF